MDFNYTMDSLMDDIDAQIAISVDNDMTVIEALIYNPLIRNIEDLLHDVVWEVTDEYENGWYE